MAKDKRQNEIFRIQKKRNNFVMMDKGFLDDDRLSYKAKGILAYLLSKPDNWVVVIKDLMNHAKDGRDSIYSGLKELKECGYYSKTPVRNEKGVVTHWDSVIYEVPEENPENTASYPLPAFPDTAFPDTEKPEHNNNYINNNDCTKNEFKSLSDNKAETPKTKNDMPTTDSTDHKTKPEPPAQKRKELTQTETPNQSTVLQSSYKKIIPNDSQFNTYVELESIVKNNISYNSFIQEQHPYIKLIDEIVFNMVDVLAETDEYIELKKGKKIKTENVKEVYLRLKHDHILYTVHRFADIDHPITNKSNYLKSILLSSPKEMESYYQNEYKQGKLW